MRLFSVSLVVAALIGVPGPAGAQASAPMAVPEPDARASEAIWAKRVEEPITRLQRARESLAAGDRTRAAAELRNAAAVLAADGHPVDEQTRVALDRAALSLRTLADDVDRGAVVSIRGLDRNLARTRIALVMLFGAVAGEAWRRGEPIRAGRVLDTATNELETAAAQTGQVLDDPTAAAIGRARWFAGRLMQGATTAPEDFQEAYEAVGTALAAVGGCLAGTAPLPRPGLVGPHAGSAAGEPDPGTSSRCDSVGGITVIADP